jgi:hypothetical protein
VTKRPPVDLMSLTAEQAAPMAEATQRVAPIITPKTKPHVTRPTREETKTENLEALAFKVPPSFRKRFRQCAVEADLKLNELLFEALDAWEERKRKK